MKGCFVTKSRDFERNFTTIQEALQDDLNSHRKVTVHLAIEATAMD